MGRALKRAFFFGGSAAIAVLAMTAHPADARTFVHLGIGVPVYAPVYYPPGVAYVYPPPVAYAPPVVTYPPPPVVYAPPPPPPQLSYAPSAYAPAPQRECREYQTMTTIGTQLQPIVGTACRQPDGTWRIVR